MSRFAELKTRRGRQGRKRARSEAAHRERVRVHGLFSNLVGMVIKEAEGGRYMCSSVSVYVLMHAVVAQVARMLLAQHAAEVEEMCEGCREPVCQYMRTHVLKRDDCICRWLVVLNRGRMELSLKLDNLAFLEKAEEGAGGKSDKELRGLGKFYAVLVHLLQNHHTLTSLDLVNDPSINVGIDGMGCVSGALHVINTSLTKLDGRNARLSADEVHSAQKKEKKASEVAGARGGPRDSKRGKETAQSFMKR